MLGDSHIDPKHIFHFELQPSYDAVRAHIRNCEGRHVQQAIFSTFMDTLTQICFTCQRIRSTIDWDGNRSWPAFAGPWIPSPEEVAAFREDVDEIVTKTVRMQRAKVAAAKILQDNGLPIPPELRVNPEEECGA